MLDKKKHKLLELKTSILVDSPFIGNYKTKHKGKGIEFVDYKEYGPEDNVKNIDFIRSAKEGKTLVKLYEEERELSVYFIFDYNSNFNELKLDIFHELVYLVGLSAIKQGDKLGSFIFNNNYNNLYYAKKGKQNFINIINGIDEMGFKNNFKLNSFIDNIKRFFIKNKLNNILNINGLSYFNSLKIKNSLVFYITDNLNIKKQDLKILSIKNDLVVCNIFDSFENTLKGNGVYGFSNGNKGLFIDLDNDKKINEYIKLRKDKIKEFKKSIIKTGSKYLLLDETKSVYKEVYKLFQNNY